MKKFFYLCFCAIFCLFSTFSLTSCKKSEVEKVSKNLTSYAIQAELFDDMKISGTERIVFYNSTGKELDFVCFHLYPRAFREGALVKPYTSLTSAKCFPNGVSFGDISILKVKVNGEVKSFEHIGEDEDILKVNLGFKLTQKKSVEIVIEFLIVIPNSTHRFGWCDENVNLGNWYPIVCAFKNGSFDTTPYFATGDPFFSEIGNYEVSLTYPIQYNLCSTGESVTTKNGNKNTTKMTAKAVRDFAICLSSSSRVVCDDVDGVTVRYMSNEKDEQMNKFLNVSIEALKFFSKTFGKYPYSTLSVVQTPFIYGGMEYPNLVFISDAIDDEKEYLKVVVHEVAHQWWYAIVGNNEVNDAWLDESLSEYSTALFFKNHGKYEIAYDDLVNDALASYLLYVDVIKTLRGDVNTKMNLPVNEYQNDYEYSYMVYVKGVIMFDSLKNVVGEKKVIAGLKKYYADNKFKVATKEDFFKAFKSACHKDLDGFFDGFLNGTTIISKIN